ncbi:MAG: CapA family protein [Clostridiales bacterium]|nr:CapA family protein [Clostridiales bacterium]
MDPNAKLSLRYRVQRSIRRRKPISPLWYLLIAAFLIGICVLLKHFPIDKKPASYDGIAGTGVFTATFAGNVNSVGDGEKMTAADYAAYFEGVKELFAKSDYVSVAVNDPILDDHVETYKSGMSVKFSEKYFNYELADALRGLNVTDAVICNRNIFRYGSKGALETAKTLEMADMYISGIETSNSVDGVDISIYNTGDFDIIHIGAEASDDRTRDYSSYDIRTYNAKDNNVARDIENIRQQNPRAFIAVTFSWGENYLLKPSSYMKKLCRSAIDAGANLVIGTGIQMVLSAEKYGDGYIFYGLGNLVSEEAYTMTQRGAILNCVFDEAGHVTYELVPLSVKNGTPQLSDSKLILRTLVSDIGKEAEYRIENGRLILN